MSESENQGAAKPESEAPASVKAGGAWPPLSKTNALLAVLVLIIIVLALGQLGSDEPVQTTVVSAASAPMAGGMSEPALPVPAALSDQQGIERKGEGRLFYTTIRIPANAETLYLSGSGAGQKADGTWGNMEEQTIDTFTKFKGILEEQGWSMSDIVQVRAFAVAGEYGLLDFDGFNRGYSRFFGTEENPQKPVRSFVQVADLVVDGWLVEIEIRAARVPDAS